MSGCGFVASMATKCVVGFRQHGGFSHSAGFAQLQMAQYPSGWQVESWAVTRVPNLECLGVQALGTEACKLNLG